jgi:hypothetical protein
MINLRPPDEDMPKKGGAIPCPYCGFGFSLVCQTRGNSRRRLCNGKGCRKHFTTVEVPSDACLRRVKKVETPQTPLDVPTNFNIWLEVRHVKWLAANAKHPKGRSALLREIINEAMEKTNGKKDEELPGNGSANCL